MDGPLEISPDWTWHCMESCGESLLACFPSPLSGCVETSPKAWQLRWAFFFWVMQDTCLGRKWAEIISCFCWPKHPVGHCGPTAFPFSPKLNLTWTCDLAEQASVSFYWSLEPFNLFNQKAHEWTACQHFGVFQRLDETLVWGINAIQKAQDVLYLWGVSVMGEKR